MASEFQRRTLAALERAHFSSVANQLGAEALDLEMPALPGPTYRDLLLEAEPAGGVQ